jgi:prepilin-type N-terminal cleavage/methylation domain-containing protein
MKHCSRKLTARVHRSAGFALVELMIALSISALLAIYAAAEIRNKSEESIAEGAAVYLSTVASASQAYVMLNFNALANGVDVPGVAVDLAPTPAELVATGRLNAAFPVGPGRVPGGLTADVTIQRQNCPGANCLLTSLACTTTPITLGSSSVRFDLASTMTTKQGGSGGQSLQGQGGFIRGPAINVANPRGNVEGIVCGSSMLDTALYQRFVLNNDTRDPNFQGPLTVAGATTLGSTLSVAGNTTLNGTISVAGNTTLNGTLSVAGDTSIGSCARILAATGRAGFGCASPNDLPVGYTGGVRTPDVVASSRILASDNPAGFTGANGAYAYMGVVSGVAEMRTSGRAVGDRLTPLGQYTAGSACAAADEASIARRAGATGLVVCQSSVWRAMATGAATGDACTPNGAMATASTGEQLLCVNGVYRAMSTIVRSGTPYQACTAAGTTAIDTASENETLICRLNAAGGSLKYMRLRDVTQHLVFVGANEVTHNTVLTRPNCAPASGSSAATSIVQLVPKSFSSPDGGFDFRASESTNSWTILLRTGGGAALSGTPVAIAQIYCYYP